MGEMTAFERQLAARLELIAGPEPHVDAVASARTAMTTASSRRPFTMSSALKFIVASVIVALFGGFLLAGILTVDQDDGSHPAIGTAPPVGALASCPSGATPDQPGSDDQARPPAAQVAAAAFDRGAGKIVYLTAGGPRETWLFDVCTNTWSLAQVGEGPDSLVSNAVYDAAAGLTLVVDGAYTWAYDSVANRWARREAVTPEGLLRLAYDPMAGQVMASSHQRSFPVWRYDAEADVWRPAKSAPSGRAAETASNRILTYDSTVDRLLAYDGGRAELFDEDSGAWVSTEARSPRIHYGGWLSWGGEITYDEAVGRTVVIGEDAVIAYDASADVWETLSLSPEIPAIGMHHKAIYDPLNERIVLLGGDVRVADPDVIWAPSDDVWAFDARTREWTELVPTAMSSAAGERSFVNEVFLEETTGVPYLVDADGTTHELTVYAPTAPGPWPTAVMIHGGGGAYGAEVLDPWARAVAAEGAVVFVPYHFGEPAWPTASAAISAITDTTAQLACAVRFAHSEAGRYGGDPVDISLFGHSSGAHFASLIALTDPVVSPGCLAEAGSAVPEALALFEGDWLLMGLPVYDPLIAEDRSVWDVLTPWPHLEDAPRLPITILDSGDPSLAIRGSELIDPVLALRDPDGVLRDGLESAGALDDEQLTAREAQHLLAEELSASGYPVSFVDLPASTHERLSDAALAMMADAIRSGWAESSVE